MSWASAPSGRLIQAIASRTSAPPTAIARTSRAATATPRGVGVPCIVTRTPARPPMSVEMAAIVGSGRLRARAIPPRPASSAPGRLRVQPVARAMTTRIVAAPVTSSRKRRAKAEPVMPLPAMAQAVVGLDHRGRDGRADERHETDDRRCRDPAAQEQAGGRAAEGQARNGRTLIGRPAATRGRLATVRAVRDRRRGPRRPTRRRPRPRRPGTRRRRRGR